MLILGLTGTKSTGKNEVAKYLEKKGYIIFTLSDSLREALKKEVGDNYTIKDLQDIANKWREERGPNALALILIERMKKHVAEGKQRFVVNGVRNPGEIEAMKNFGNFVLISVDAPPKMRFERMKVRGLVGDYTRLEDFQKMDARDRGLNEPDTGQQVGLCMKQADFHIINDSTLETLHKKVKQVLEKIE